MRNRAYHLRSISARPRRLFGISSGSVEEAPPATPIIHDAFGGAGAGLDGRTPDTVTNGNNWVAAAELGTDGSTLGNASGISIGVVQANANDVRVEIDINQGDSDAGPIMRYSDANNYIYARYVASTIEIIKVEAGTPGIIGSGGASGSSGTLTLSGNGLSISASFNGVPTGAVLSSFNQGEGKVGVQMDAVPGLTMDNFKVYEI